MVQSDEGLEQAVRKSPNDPVPRLVYADWLDDRGLAFKASMLRLWVAAHEIDREPLSSPLK